jgi:hypothetical protein
VHILWILTTGMDMLGYLHKPPAYIIGTHSSPSGLFCVIISPMYEIDTSRWTNKERHIKVKLCEKCGRRYLPIVGKWEDTDCALCHFGIVEVKQMISKIT